MRLEPRPYQLWIMIAVAAMAVLYGLAKVLGISE